MRTFLKTLAVVILLYCLMFHGLGARELWSSHEGRAAQDAQSILDGGDWRLPHLFDGRAELQKPPLYYWITAGLGWFRGAVDETTVRLPAVLGALLTGLALWVLLRHSRQPRAAWLSVLILWTMIHFTWMSRVGRIDMPLTATVSWSLVSFLIGAATFSWRRHAWFFLGYLSLAAGLLLKGPIAAVLLAVILLPWWLMQWLSCPTPRQDELTPEPLTPARRSILPVLVSASWGIPLLIALILPWCWWVNDATGGKFIDEFVIKHNFQRGFGGDEQLDGHVHPLWFYCFRFWVDTAPWGWLLPVVIVAVVRRKITSPLALLGLVWFTAIFCLLSLMQYKRADYLLPAYPGLALALGVSIDAWLKQCSIPRQRLYLNWSLTLASCLALGWFTYIQWLLPLYEPQKSLRPFAHRVREFVPSPGQVILFRIDSHHLTWELGKKAERIWEWENLSWWATRPAQIFVIMPLNYAQECKQQLQAGELIPLLGTNDYAQGNHELPLVLLVSNPALADHSTQREGEAPAEPPTMAKRLGESLALPKR